MTDVGARLMETSTNKENNSSTLTLNHKGSEMGKVSVPVGSLFD